MRSKISFGTIILARLKDAIDDEYVYENIKGIVDYVRAKQNKKEEEKVKKIWGKKRCVCGKWIKWRAKICRPCYLRSERKKGGVKRIKNHGSSRGYQTGCRCLECKAWKREYNSKRVWK